MCDFNLSVHLSCCFHTFLRVCILVVVQECLVLDLTYLHTCRIFMLLLMFMHVWATLMRWFAKANSVAQANAFMCSNVPLFQAMSCLVYVQFFGQLPNILENMSSGIL